MKKLLSISFMLTVLLSMTGITTYAHDFEAVNAEGKTIYYNYNGDGTSVSVSYRGSIYYEYFYEYNDDIVIPESVTYNETTYSVTSIGTGAFFGCDGLTSITIPNSVTAIGDMAFYGCCFLTSVTISNSVTSIGRSAFYNCSDLTSVTIPKSVTSIGEYAFAYCSCLTSITIPNSVTAIGEFTFYNCSGLTSVTIGNSVTSIENYTFYGCTSLLNMYCYAENVPITGSNAFDYSNVANATLHVPAGSVGAYQAAEPWYLFKEIVALTDSDPNPTDIKMLYSSDYEKATFYDLNGCRVEQPSKGLYIKNGKKYVVK